MMNGLFFFAEMTGWFGAMLPLFERAAHALRTALAAKPWTAPSARRRRCC